MIVERKDRNSPLNIKMTKTIKTLNKSTLIDPHICECYAESYNLPLKFCKHSKCMDLFYSPYYY